MIELETDNMIACCVVDGLPIRKGYLYRIYARIHGYRAARSLISMYYREDIRDRPAV